MQHQQPLARRRQVVGQRGIQGGQVAPAAGPRHPAAPPAALPVEKAKRQVIWCRGGTHQEVLGVQVGVLEAGVVQSRQRGAQLAGDVAPLRERRGRHFAQELPQILIPFQIAHQEEGPAVIVLAGGDRFGTAHRRRR